MRVGAMAVFAASAALGASVACGSGNTASSDASQPPAPAIAPAAVSEPLPVLANLRTRFPVLANRVLRAGNELAAFDAGFTLSRAAHRDRRTPPLLVLPREGSETIRVRGFGGFEVRVREIGTYGRGLLAERAVVYERRGGAALWIAGSAGVEEWLYVEPGQAGEVLTAWTVEGVVVRQRGTGADAGVELVDATGVVRMSVSAPRGYAANGGEVAVSIKGNGTRIELHVEPRAEALLIDPLWLPTGSLNTARTDGTALLLENGKVLIAGGFRHITLNSEGLIEFSVPGEGELYDPVTNAWSATARMLLPRFNHTATRLRDGRVLFAGGIGAQAFSSNAAFREVEIYDPSTNAFVSAAAMNEARRYHAATLLANGRVLVVGGTSSNVELASAEIYDPVADAWSSAAPLAQPRIYHAASLLKSGKVLVGGGGSLKALLRAAEVYDPESNSWSAGGEYTHIQQMATATVLENGKVLLAGGFDNSVGLDTGNLASAALYDPASNTWSETGALVEGRYQHCATLLANGRVLVAGGTDYNGGGASQATAELYDPAKNGWSATVTMAQARAEPAAVLLANGEVLIAGGFDERSSLATAERFSLSSLDLGAACKEDAQCASGFCTDGVCCNTACEAGDCDACSLALGAEAQGTCILLTGAACAADRACWEPGTCQAGVCEGARPAPDGLKCAGGNCMAGACLPIPDAGVGGSDAGRDAAADAEADIRTAGTGGAAPPEAGTPADSSSHGGGDGQASPPKEAGMPGAGGAPPTTQPLARPAGNAEPNEGCACRAAGAERWPRVPLGFALLLGWLSRRSSRRR